jgi:hypothetical protein
MTALGVAILFLLSIADVLSLTAILLASVCLFITAEELGTFKALMVYIATGVLAVLLLGGRLTAIEYLLFGFYPVLKRLIEKTPKAVSLMLKGLYIVAATVADMLIIKFFFPQGDEELYIQIIAVVASFLWLVLYDICYTRLARYYHFKLRAQLRIDRFFR